jgi:hypothetical protein
MEIYDKICPIGPWLPNHLTLAHKLMLAIKKSGIDTKVVNGAYPDLTNVVLAKVGLSPVCGGGNMDLGLSRVKRLVAREMKVPFNSVSIYGVGHHGAYYTAKMNGPIWVKVLEEAGYMKMSSFKGPLVDQMRTASSFLKHVLAIYHDTSEIHTCVTGPNGLPGGYPTKLSSKGAEVMPFDLSLEEAIEINEAGALLDGIEKVRDDGTVVFAEKNVNLMRETLGYECEELKINEAEERAEELNLRLGKLYEQYKII